MAFPFVLDRAFAISEQLRCEARLRKAAQKGLDKMSSKAARALSARLEAIAAAPEQEHRNVKPLTGYPNGFRLRQGGWRAVYELDRAADELRVVRIDVRGSVYR